MVHITLKNVNYSYPVFDKNRSIKTAILKSVVGGDIVNGRRGVMVHALKDIELNLKPGDRFGILGHNGSGKTTILRVIAGLIPPDSGTVDLEGRVLSLIQRGVGINEELSGRDNLELPLRMLGATDEEVKRGKAEIPEFIELGSFIDLPVRAYSEGMKARLSFGISTFLRGDILLLDEWIATGDKDFVAKANAHMDTILDETGILVIATHSTGLVKNVCNKVALMDSGSIVMVGTPEEVVAHYDDSYA